MAAAQQYQILPPRKQEFAERRCNIHKVRSQASWVNTRAAISESIQIIMLSLEKANPLTTPGGLHPGGLSPTHHLPPSDELYHILLTVSNIHKGANADLGRTRICDTYTDLAKAKAAAHRCLFDAGYEREWFVEFDTSPDQFPPVLKTPAAGRVGLQVLAIAPDSTTFSVSILTAPNLHGERGDSSAKVCTPLYHVFQTVVRYNEDGGLARESWVEGSFDNYTDAVAVARSALLSEDDGITKSSFADYSEATPQASDCGFQEDVVVHAVGYDGNNFIVEVLKTQEMEAVRVEEAARRLRE